MFRWAEHTAELELQIEASSEAAVFEEALIAFAELLGDGGGDPMTRELEVEAEESSMLLVEWLSELVYLSEAEQFVPAQIASLELSDGRLRATLEGHRGEPRHLVKAVTLHRLALWQDEAAGWHARVVLDV